MSTRNKFRSRHESHGANEEKNKLKHTLSNETKNCHMYK